MHKDTLKTDQFVVNGKDFRTANQLDLGQVKSFFKVLGYNVLEISQPWRSVSGHLKKGNEDFYLKMASTSDLSERLKNEVAWNNQIGEQLSGKETFRVPKVMETGEYENLSYYISEYVPGVPLSATHKPVSTNLDAWLDKIINCNHALLKMNLALPKDKQYENFNEKKKQVQSTWQKFFDQVKEHDLDEVFEQIKLYEKYYEPALNHYDFVPWHMLQEQDKFVLIDAEHAASRGPKFYDVIYFFHRVYTSGNAPEVAREYITAFQSILSISDKEAFTKLTRPILASRIIGGFWDAKNHGNKDFSIHNQIKLEFLQGAIV